MNKYTKNIQKYRDKINMKMTMYFSSTEEMNNYFPSGIPSNVLAIVQPDAETPAALYTSSNNSPVGGGSSEEQGGGGQGADTIEDKISKWQDKFGDALQAVATAIYQNDNLYGEPIIKDNADWCVKTALDGDAALSDMTAMATLWNEIYAGGSMLHTIWSQVLSNLDITITDEDKEIPFEVGENSSMVITTPKNVSAVNGLAGFKNSNNSSVLSDQWSWYGLVWNGTALEYSHITDTNNDVDLKAMFKKMQDDGVQTADAGNPILPLANYANYIKAYENGANYYWCPDSENEPTTYYPFVEVTDEGDGSKHYSYSLGNLAETKESAAVFANINTDRFNWNGFLYFDPFEVSSETVEGYKESRPIQLVRSDGESGPDKSGGINLVETTLTNATLEIANDELGFPVIILTNGE
jgi:hypothetical protein